MIVFFNKIDNYLICVIKMLTMGDFNLPHFKSIAFIDDDNDYIVPFHHELLYSASLLL